MKNYTKRNATYHGIPCWYNPVTEELSGKTRFFDFLVLVFIWVDARIFQVEEFRIWVEKDELEN